MDVPMYMFKRRKLGIFRGPRHEAMRHDDGPARPAAVPQPQHRSKLSYDRVALSRLSIPANILVVSPRLTYV